MMDSLARLRRLAVPMVATIVFAACGSVRYAEQYVLQVPPPVALASSQPSTLEPITVRQFGCPDYLCDGRIVYRPAPEQIAFYEYHRWAVDPREALTQLVVERLRARSQFTNVEQTDQPTATKYVLRGDIQRFEEVDQDRSVLAICTISAEVVDTNTHAVVWRSTASETVPVQQRNVPGVVTSLSAAARTVVERLVSEMEGDLRRKGAS